MRPLTKRVSIHAPARGATKQPYCHSWTHCSFNPRAREGRDDALTNLSVITGVFQSTRPRGARRYGRIGSCNVSKFQSTRPRGARQRRLAGLYPLRLFQSTRPRGARLCVHLRLRYNVKVSIHAPARGATRCFRSSVPNSHVSIHAPARGATATRALLARPCRVSIHAPARGATRIIDISGSACLFQSTRPRGARHAHRRSCAA